MVKKVLAYIDQYGMIEPEDMVVAGISGGADSVCLLFMLFEIKKSIPFTLKVVHVNHGIRADAAADADYVRQLCGKLKVPFELVEADVEQSAGEHGTSTEEEGRRIRYEAFERALGSVKGKIAVAHNSNDRAETMLFHLFRGASLSGICGIPPVNGRIIRPLLCLQRSEIEDWLQKKGISFCTDSTNGEDLYTRNRIRHHILPYAEQDVCQGAVRNMNRAAEQLLEAREYIGRQTREALKRCTRTKRDGTVLIRIPEFLREDRYLQGHILLACIDRTGGGRRDITSSHIHSMIHLFQGTGSKELHLPHGLVVYKEYEMGMLQRKDKIRRNGFLKAETGGSFQVEIPSVITVPGLGKVEFTVFPRQDSQNIPEKKYTKWFDYDKISSVVALRTRRPGDFLTINSRMGCQSLQNYFVNQKVPRERRDEIYLLAEGAHILWIPGGRISEYYKINENTESVLQVCILDKEQDLRKEFCV